MDLLSNISAWSYGLWAPSAWVIVAYTLIVTHITIVSVTLYLHRHSAHRALDLHPLLKHFFRFWLWLTTGIGTKTWTAIHRKHHATTDTAEDPHSPQILGLKALLLTGVEIYRAADTQATRDRFGKGTPEDWVERNLYRRFTFLGIGLMLVLNVVLFGPIGLTVWAIQMLWIPFLATGVINGIGHYWGYRNFECPDAATNVFPWGVLIGGEELHNNHHTYPNSAKLSVRPWEFDIGWFWIRVFQLLRLAQPLSTGPVVERVSGKQSIDTDTAWALLNDRFRVMASYANEVVAPLVEEECSRADKATRKLLKRAKSLLCREESLLDEAAWQRIAHLVEANPMLKTLYDLKVQLQQVWAKRGGHSEEMLSALVQWCKDAEETGIQHLSDFVEELKGYTIPGRHAAAL